MDQPNDSVFSYHSTNPCDRFVEACIPGDEQAIPFLQTPESRLAFRERRKRTYRSFRSESIPLDVESEGGRGEGRWFRFEACYAGAPCKVEHFQLKHCVQTCPPNSLYLSGPQSGQLSLFDPLTHLSHPLLCLTGVDSMAITSFSIHSPLIATGGLNGQLFIDTIEGKAKSRNFLSPREQGNITNNVNFVEIAGGVELMVGSNNKTVWFFDVEMIPVPKREFRAEYNVNCVALSPNSSLIGLVGDSVDCHILSADTMEAVHTLKGHKDHNFSVAWHPQKDYLLATGGQDHSVRLWDLRAVGEARCLPVATLFGEMAGVLNVQFTGDGELLAWSETVDYLHLTDALLFSSTQSLSFFGEIAGFSFSQESSTPASLYVGICDSTFPAIYEARRIREGVEGGI